MEKVAVVGLGPVGLATTWNLLRNGYSVAGVDSDPALCALYAKGEFPRTPALAAELKMALGTKFSLESSLDSCGTCVSFVVCVDTPFDGKEFHLGPLRSATESVFAVAGLKNKVHIIIRSTLLPGTMSRLGLECEHSYYPEFLRMPDIREDILDPPLRVAAHSSPAAEAAFLRLFPDAAETLPDFATAEALKLACNAFHAMKVVFANEVGDICARSGIPASSVMDAFCRDRKLNLSGKYLVPGRSFDGPCLDKDLQALEGFMDRLGVEGDLLRAIRASNGKRRLLESSR